MSLPRQYGFSVCERPWRRCCVGLFLSLPISFQEPIIFNLGNRVATLTDEHPDEWRAVADLFVEQMMMKDDHRLYDLLGYSQLTVLRKRKNIRC